jgi:elongator complex protein 3
VIRDFSAGDIVAGNKVANLREVAERELVSRGEACRDIRAREIRDEPFDVGALELRETGYRTSIGREVFLQWVTPADRLVAFLRLSLPVVDPPIGELRGCAVIREVHVYGASVPLRQRARGRAQHRGLGRALIERAADCALAAGYPELAVISAVGTRSYYRQLGFRAGALYQHRALGPSRKFPSASA